MPAVAELEPPSSFIDDNVRAGMTEAARCDALIRLGGLDATKGATAIAAASRSSMRCGRIFVPRARAA
jgi:hypothetical protein